METTKDYKLSPKIDFHGKGDNYIKIRMYYLGITEEIIKNVFNKLGSNIKNFRSDDKNISFEFSISTTILSRFITKMFNILLKEDISAEGIDTKGQDITNSIALINPEECVFGLLLSYKEKEDFVSEIKIEDDKLKKEFIKLRSELDSKNNMIEKYKDLLTKKSKDNEDKLLDQIVNINVKNIELEDENKKLLLQLNESKKLVTILKSHVNNLNKTVTDNENTINTINTKNNKLKETVEYFMNEIKESKTK